MCIYIYKYIHNTYIHVPKRCQGAVRTAQGARLASALARRRLVGICTYIYIPYIHKDMKKKQYIYIYIYMYTHTEERSRSNSYCARRAPRFGSNAPPTGRPSGSSVGVAAVLAVRVTSAAALEVNSKISSHL